MFKVKLLTPRVSANSSHAAGDEIEVPNDEAYRMIAAGLAEAVGKKQPEKPAPKEKASEK